jgi:predicted TIM-barrel fold metal-dependent hydrolase
MIDCHTHLWREEDWSEEMLAEASIARGGPADVEVSENAHLAAMAPVERAIVFGFHARHLGFVVPNDRIARYVAANREKLLGFACIDPNEPDYMDELERVFAMPEFCGLKLAPIYQNYHPMDQRMQPVYAFCERRSIPILFHQGTTFPRRAPLKYALPIQLEDVAMAYPELRIVIAHLGHPWVEDTIVLIRKQPHMYADISALYYRPWQFYNALMLAQEYGVMHKLLFGSDYPFTTPAASIAALRKVNHVIGYSDLPRVREEAIEGILHRDTLKLLQIPS